MYQTAAAQSKDNRSTSQSHSTTGVLVVGPGIVLSGEIGTCERLDVQGKLTANLTDTRDFSVATGGQFEGNARVQSATIAGHFDGDLDVEGLLTIESTGRLTGSVRFGELQVMRGGVMRGEVAVSGG